MNHENVTTETHIDTYIYTHTKLRM